MIEKIEYVSWLNLTWLAGLTGVTVILVREELANGKPRTFLDFTDLGGFVPSPAREFGLSRAADTSPCQGAKG